MQIKILKYYKISKFVAMYISISTGILVGSFCQPAPPLR